MEWTCRECGNEVTADDVVLVVTIGWVALDGDTGVCPLCKENGSDPLVPSPLGRIEASRRHIEATRELIRKSCKG
jgi:hypothetical protein